MSSSSLRERLRAGLLRTREKLGAAFGGSDAPDWDALEESLVLADIGLPAASAILKALRKDGIGSVDILRGELLGILRAVGSSERAPIAPPRITMIVGINGVGKTTTVAKLAARSAASGESTLVVAADTFRAAAQEQLAAWAERIGVDLVEGAAGRDPASVVHEGVQVALGRGVDEVFIDTAGRLHTKRPLMDELAKMERVTARLVPDAPHEILLVMDATVGSNGLSQARQFKSSLGVTGIVLTKMDGTAKGGVVIAIAKELGLPVRYVGVGESVNDLLPFAEEDFVDALLN